MPGNIFVSYRRGDASKDARALYERLRREFGGERVFIDLEGIEPGEDFVTSLERQLDDCEALVAVIGRGWADAINERGERRLDDENDFVRIELRAALQRGIRVFPVLVDGAPPPRAEELPEDLRALVRRQAIALDYAKFDDDVARLCRAIRKASGAVAPAPAPVRPPGSLPAESRQVSPAAQPQDTAASRRTDAALATQTVPPAARAGRDLPSHAFGVGKVLAVFIGSALALALLGYFVARSPDDSVLPPPAELPAKPTATVADGAPTVREPTDAEVRAEYERRKARASALEYRARHILVQSEAEAERLRLRILGGDLAFEAAARQFSKDPGSAALGGDLDFASPDAFIKPFADAMVGLRKGEVSAPVRTEFGWHLVRVDDVRPAAYPAYEQIRASIRDELLAGSKR